ncbi:unnamed protein product [Fraxinus pennsylvanica]|uniref:BHLH domain-containing protein n=1 Tax=Fraxinus pennsylvanica TaxID=56036 RepID=A0AAD2EDM8_9LAMI|nr:unnamed protein product [Fraxinus pennsylvanica]
MAEEFHDGGNWWSSSRIAFDSPCSLAINGVESFGWPGDHHMMMNMKTTRSGDNESGSASDGSIVLQEMQKPDSILQMMGITLSPSTAAVNWNQDLLKDNGISQGNYSQILQQDLNSSMNFSQQLGVDCPQIQNDWSSRNISGDVEDSSINSLKQINSSNSTPSWTTAAVASNNIGNIFPSTKSQFLLSALDVKPNLPNLAAKANKTAGDLNPITNKSSNKPTFKRPRLETPSPLPTFKVGKGKLGDRITALQQLVSPFGKTDTASVLQEVIEYIKFLHDQVSVLSTPYMKNVPPVHRQQTAGKLKDQEGSKLDLKSRGLCLVPISSTFLIAAENTSDFWTPVFGGRFRKSMSKKKRTMLDHLMYARE